ncbi:MAG TPA: GNAT family N-acetyltransferase, partial [Gemmatimonadaceae bacterium]|nr:GNAT family N-acetyltransferase [Gemmatimonadaceae bacterium]
PAFSWWLEPGVPAASWKPLLVAQGFSHEPELPGLALRLADLDGTAAAGAIPPDSARLEIFPVETPSARRAWAETFVAGNEYRADMAGPLFDVYGDLHGPGSPLVSYLAYADGVPVATSSVFYAAGVAGLYDIATLPAWRGRGIGSAVTRTPLLAARGRGYRAAVLQSSSKGVRLYERLGFRTVCNIEHFVRDAGRKACLARRS